MLKQKTDKWVVPEYITKLVDEDRYKEALVELEKQAFIWPNDPEITYYRTLVDFLVCD